MPSFLPKVHARRDILDIQHPLACIYYTNLISIRNNSSKWLSIVFLPSRNMIENITKIREKIGKDILKMYKQSVTNFGICTIIQFSYLNTLYYYEFTGFPREDIEDDLETFIQQSKINYYQVLMPLSELPVKFYFNKRNQLLRYKQVLDAKNGSRKRIEDQLWRKLANIEKYVPLKEYQSYYMKCVTDHSFLPLCFTFTPKNANLEEGYGPEEDSIMFICNNLNKKKQKKPVKDCLKTIKMFELDYIDDGIITDPEMQNEEIVEAFDILIQRYSISNGSLDPLMSYEPDVLIRSGVYKFQVIYREMPEENKYCKEYLLPEIVHLVKKTFENKFEAVKIDYNSQEERDDIKSILETYKRGEMTSSLEKSFVKFELYQPPDPDSNHYNTLYLLFADEEYKENAYNLIASITNNASSHQSDTSSEEKLAYGSSHSTFTRSFISEEDSDVTSSSSRIGTDESRLFRESNILNKYSKILSKINCPKSYSSFEVDQDKEEESKINFSAVRKFQKNLQYLTSNLGVLYTTQAIKNEYLLLNPPEYKNCDVREIELVKSLFNILKKSFNHSEQVQGLDSRLIGQMVIGELIKKSRYLFEPDSTFVWAFVGEDDSYKILDPNLNFYLETLYQEKILEYQDPISLSQTSLGSKTSGASSENASNSFLMTKKYYDLEGEHRIKVSIKTKRFEKHLTKKKYKDKLK